MGVLQGGQITEEAFRHLMGRGAVAADTRLCPLDAPTLAGVTVQDRHCSSYRVRSKFHSLLAKAEMKKSLWGYRALLASLQKNRLPWLPPASLGPILEGQGQRGLNQKARWDPDPGLALAFFWGLDRHGPRVGGCVLL